MSFSGRKVRYAVQYSFTKNYENSWLMKATFTKHLAAFTKVFLSVSFMCAYFNIVCFRGF